MTNSRPMLLPPPSASATPELAPLDPRALEPPLETASKTPFIYASEPPPKQALFWRMLKFPLRQLLKGIYFGAQAIRTHQRTAIAIALVLIIGGGTGYYTYQRLQPKVEIIPLETRASLPPLPNAVKHLLHGLETANAHELWTSLSPDYQQTFMAQSVGESQIQSALDKNLASGLSYDKFIYTGGYLADDGTSNYIVHIVESEQGQSSTRTFYFVVNSDGLLTFFNDITP